VGPAVVSATVTHTNNENLDQKFYVMEGKIADHPTVLAVTG